jgi:hypothetical protein
LNDDAGPGGSDGERTPGTADIDRQLAEGEYDYAKARFIKSFETERSARFWEQASRQRAKLREEINNLRLVTVSRHETAVEHARAYGAILPHRVGKTWIQPPATFESVDGAARAYKRAAHSAKEYLEARMIFIKRRDQLIMFEEQLRKRLDDRESVLLSQLDSPRMLKAALMLDPLLNMSYQKLQALRADLPDQPIEDGLGDL